MPDKPSQEEIDSAIKDLALRELDDKPVGSVVTATRRWAYGGRFACTDFAQCLKNAGSELEEVGDAKP